MNFRNILGIVSYPFPELAVPDHITVNLTWEYEGGDKDYPTSAATTGTDPVHDMSPPAFAAAAATSFTTSFRGSMCAPRNGRPMSQTRPVKRAALRMGAADVIAKKAVVVDAVKARLDASQMIFSVELNGLTVSDRDEFKKSLPAGSSSMTVKNTLMRRAIAETGWEVAGDITKNSTIWVFVGEDIKGTVEAYTKFAKDKEREPTYGGVLEGVLYDDKGIAAIAALPTKTELIAKFARLINMIPTKIGRSVNQVPTKLARSIKLAVADEDAAAAPAAEAAAE